MFPLEEFRKSCSEVIASDEAAPFCNWGARRDIRRLRRYLLEQARAEGVARESDDILITSGCQQAFDSCRGRLARARTVLIEDPVYLGVRSVFERAGARLHRRSDGAGWHRSGKLERVIISRAAALALRHAQFSESDRRQHAAPRAAGLASHHTAAGVMVIENDIYGPLCYEGEPIPSIKHLDETGDTILLRSFSKVAFPGLRVGWVMARRALLKR